MYQRTLAVLTCCLAACGGQSAFAVDTVARQWDEALLEAIRIDFPAPTVHSRNLYHTSAAMYDAWSVYDNTALGVFYKQKHTAGDVEAARNEAISYAAYRILSERYTHAVDPNASQAIFDNVMGNLGYDPGITTTIGDSPAAIGNRIAAQILTSQLNDGSNESNDYVDNTGYVPVNEPMIVDHPSVTGPNGGALANPNQWQPLYLDSSVTQNGLEGQKLQVYVGPHWGNVTTFAMGKNGSGPYSWSEIDPGPPPQLNGLGDADYRQETVDLIRFSNRLDPTQGDGSQMIDISPASQGNRVLGTHDDPLNPSGNEGYSINPVTGLPYTPQEVRLGDYGRVLAEFWADGPASETPPGHWNTLANQVSDSPLLEKKLGGTGPVVSDLEWDVKLYLSLNGAVHDAAVGAWGTKREYNYVRPITKIRYQGSLGQSSDPNDTATYHPDGLPLEPELIEVITASSIADGGKHRNAYLNANQLADGTFIPDLVFTESQMVGKIVVKTWNHEPQDPETELSGIDWILAENWVPYQRDSFVTPAFAAYVSGHSTFSRAAAEVMSLFTGSEYFPGGLGELTFSMNNFLDFELGPSTDVTLQWAKYFDAADEAGISRLYGGIHVPVDDFGGRIMGSTIGQEAFALAMQHYLGVPEPHTMLLATVGLAAIVLLGGRRSLA